MAAPRCPQGLPKRPAPPLPIRSALRADIAPPAELPDASPRDFRFICTALPARAPPAYVQNVFMPECHTGAAILPYGDRK